MPEDPNQFGEGRPSQETMKQLRYDHPSGWLHLSKDPARALLVDAILDSPPGHQFSPPQIAERAGISDQSVRNHIEELVDLGVVTEADDSQYRIQDRSRVLDALENLNGAVNAVISGNSDPEIAENGDPTSRIHNIERDTEDELLDEPPSAPGRGLNAD